MSNSSNIDSLKKLSRDRLNDALKEIQSHREKCSPTNEERFLTAEYLLREAIEYIDGAWEMVASEKYNASIVLSRWVLEASIKLLWTVSDSSKIEERLKIFVGEALRCEANLLGGLAKLWPDQSQSFITNAKKAREVKESLGVEKLKSLDKIVEDIRRSDKDNWPELYPLYRICCAEAHPNLKVWERFCSAADSIVSKNTIDKKPIACWMAAAPTLYLIESAYCLIDIRNKQELAEWWRNQVVPLLKSQ